MTHHKTILSHVTNLSFDLMVVQDIQEVAQYLELKFKINLEWLDARVSYYNIKQESNLIDR